MLRPNPGIASCKSTLVQHSAGMSLMGCHHLTRCSMELGCPARLCCPMPRSECPRGLHFSLPVAVRPSLLLSWWPRPLELEQGACETVLAEATEGGEQADAL